MKRSLALTCLLLTAMAIVSPIVLQAQTSAVKVDSTKEDGLKVTKFETPYGNLVVNLPDDMSDSDTLSGTVVVEPLGSTEEEKKSNSDTLEGYVIEVAPKKAPEKKLSCKPIGDYVPFCLSIPNVCGAVDVIVTRHVSAAIDSPSEPVATCSVPCLPKPPAMCVPPDKAILPTKASCGKPMVIKGKCDGKFTNSAVYVSKVKCPMLAESPRQQVAQSPKDLTGKLEIESVEGKRKICGTFINMPIAMSCPPVKEAKMADVQYMTMRTPSAPTANKIDLTGNWIITAKNTYGSQDVPTTITHVGNQATWGAAGEGWSVSYRGVLTGNSLDTTEIDNDGKFSARGVLSYDPTADTLSGTLTFMFANGPQGVTVDIVMHRASR